MEFSRITSSRLWHAGAAIFYVGLALWGVGRLLENFGPKPKTPRVEGNFICETTIFKELDSPDKKLMATLLMVNCGGTTAFSSGITILNRSDGKTYAGLFALTGRPDGLDVSWTNNYTLTVSGFAIENLRAFTQEPRSGAVVVIKP